MLIEIKNNKYYFAFNVIAYVIIIVIIEALLEGLFSNPDNRFIAALLDPSGLSASNYYTRYWTVSEQNELYLPLGELLIYNRLIFISFGSTSAIFLPSKSAP